MLGGQQIPAYKTIMKTPRHRPRRSVSDTRLFRVIVWGSVLIISVAILVALFATRVLSFEFSADPVILGAVPIALTLYFCWWWTDVAPIVSRWLIISVISVAAICCAVVAWVLPIWEQVQLAVLLVYMVAIFRTAWQQLHESPDENNEAKST